MIRFSLLQFRIQAMVALGGLLAVAVLAAITGPHLAQLYATDIAGCRATDCPEIRDAFLASDQKLRTWLNILVTVVPGIIGLFWGAPLVAREVETGTFRLAWTQSVTRTRWLATKLGVIAAISMAVTALLSLLVTWWARPLDRARADRFATFEQRDLVPIGYAVFALALGVTLGIVIRRTLPALASTLVVFVAARLAVTSLLRSHLIAPKHLVSTLQASRVGYGRKSSTGGRNLFPDPPHLPNAWIISTRVVSDTGHALTSGDLSGICPTLRLDGPNPASGATGQVLVDPKTALRGCVSKVSETYHVVVTYQPANRYWAFQCYELAIFLAAALILSGACFWAVRRRLS